MRLKSMLSLSLLVGLAAVAHANDNSSTFLKKAAQGGIAEVSMSQLALKKTGNAEVKEFAEMMIRDHRTANARVETLAKQKKVALPMEASAADKAKEKKLMDLAGAKFDEEYMDENVDAHEKTVKLFKKQAEEGTDKDVKAFAAETLPKLEHHLMMAKQLEDKLDDAHDAKDAND